ncbi:MAG: AmmeMemoRadiSam system protein B, partial [Elusimicrobia bacterium]|nr:AmmeMemoRadiSam system protein B [Elusimicrobiota bacterium]
MPVEEDGKAVFALRDLEELTDKPLALSGGGMLLASLLDGARTAAQVRDEYFRNSGATLELTVITDLVKALDDAGYLETPAVAEKRKKAFEYFRADPKRPAVFAGPPYPAQPLPLEVVLGKFFSAENGPGKEKKDSPARPAPLGLIAPHIDFTRGGPAYAWAYQALSERKAPDIVIALGVAHVSPDSPWVFTPKSF